MPSFAFCFNIIQHMSFILKEHINKINENSPLYCCYARSGASSSRIFADSIGEKKTSEVKIVQQEVHFTNFFDFVKSFIYCIIY